METTARLLTCVSSPSSGAASISTMFWPGVRDGHADAALLPDLHGAVLDRLAVAADGDRDGTGGRALVLDAERDGLLLADDAEARRRDQRDAAVALVGAPRDERMHRRAEAEFGRIGRHVVHAAVRDDDRAGDAIRRHVRERRGERGEQPRAVGLAVGLAGFGDAHFEALDAAEALRRWRRGRPRSAAARSPKPWLGLLSMMTAATEVSGSRSSRVNEGLASASTRQASAPARTKAPRARDDDQQRRDHDRDRDRGPKNRQRDQRRECDTEIQTLAPTAPAAPAAPGHAPDRPCSCRSACTSRC